MKVFRPITYQQFIECYYHYLFCIGGGKVWECTQDLGNFLTDLENDCDAAFIDDFENKNILDLGCGAGILGILALKSNAKSVTFQDYVGTFKLKE